MPSDRFRNADGKTPAEESESFSLDAKFVDLNGDGAPDLYVTNDFEDPDQLWINDGHGHAAGAQGHVPHGECGPAQHASHVEQVGPIA